MFNEDRNTCYDELQSVSIVQRDVDAPVVRFAEQCGKGSPGTF